MLRALVGAALVAFGGYAMLQEVIYRRAAERWDGMHPDGRALDVLARTIYGEARGEGAAGMIAVAHVIKNRADRPGWWGRTIEEVCRKPWQFSAWNWGDPNRIVMLNATREDAGFAQAVEIARGVLTGAIPDPTGGATHYHARSVAPAWADAGKVSAEIGNHIFYAGLA